MKLAVKLALNSDNFGLIICIFLVVSRKIFHNKWEMDPPPPVILIDKDRIERSVSGVTEL